MRVLISNVSESDSSSLLLRFGEFLDLHSPIELSRMAKELHPDILSMGAEWFCDDAMKVRDAALYEVCISGD